MIKSVVLLLFFMILWIPPSHKQGCTNDSNNDQFVFPQKAQTKLWFKKTLASEAGVKQRAPARWAGFIDK